MAAQAAAAAAVAALKASAAAEAPPASSARLAELDRRAGDLASAFAREQSARCSFPLHSSWFAFRNGNLLRHGFCLVLKSDHENKTQWAWDLTPEWAPCAMRQPQA